MAGSSSAGGEAAPAPRTSPPLRALATRASLGSATGGHSPAAQGGPSRRSLGHSRPLSSGTRFPLQRQRSIAHLGKVASGIIYGEATPPLGKVASGFNGSGGGGGGFSPSASGVAAFSPLGLATPPLGARLHDSAASAELGHSAPLLGSGSWRGPSGRGSLDAARATLGARRAAALDPKRASLDAKRAFLEAHGGDWRPIPALPAPPHAGDSLSGHSVGSVAELPGASAPGVSAPGVRVPGLSALGLSNSDARATGPSTTGTCAEGAGLATLEAASHASGAWGGWHHPLGRTLGGGSEGGDRGGVLPVLPSQLAAMHPIFLRFSGAGIEAL